MAGRTKRKDPTSDKVEPTRPGPKTKLDDSTRRIILEALEKKMPLSFAADLAGVDRSTVYNHMNADKEFSTRVAMARAVAIRGLVDATEKQGGAWKLLKNLGREEFKEHVEVEQKSEITLLLETDEGEEEFDL